jgi:GNAT superfamily N-acetyltransferase
MIRNDLSMVEPVATRHGAIRVRSEGAADENFLFALFESVKGPEFARMPIGEPMLRNLLNMQYRAMITGYRAAFPTARFEVVLLNDEPIGRLITDRDSDWFHVIYIALVSELRNKGIGATLMAAVLDEPRRLGLRCEATVAVDNVPSLRLWSQLGFIERERNLTDVVVEWSPA